LHELAEHVAETLDIGPGTRVFEVDCGDGAFLLPFHQNGYVVGGSDGDPAMIEHAIAAMPGGLFTVAVASALDPAVPWDVVVCRSLAGVADTDYLRGLVARTFAKATHAIALLNVPEKHHRPLLHALTEAGARAIQIDGADIFARV
jgi:2-polyprenyl-3-methyl-5-hydroxy-6-metoxy-1,4-benzoquinol methylase